MGRLETVSHDILAVLPVARELVALTKYVSAQVDSRLAGSGLLLLPQGIESAFSKPAPEVDDDGNVIDEDDDQTFADELTDYMIVPVQDREVAGSVVPFMATVPPELVDKIKLVSFATPLDEHAPPLREEAIRRVGLGMDSDPSVLLGQASSNHWCKDELTEILVRGKGWITHKSLEIGDEVMVGAQSGISKSVAEKSIVSGSPAVEQTLWKKSQIALLKLPEALKTIRKLEQRLHELETRMQKDDSSL